jgi:hypothetical protein
MIYPNLTGRRRARASSHVHGPRTVIPFVKAVYEGGMLAKADGDWMACSPDGIALIDIRERGLGAGDACLQSNISLLLRSKQVLRCQVWT